MEGVLKVLIIGGAVVLSMWFAYLSSKAKAAAWERSHRKDDDAPGREEFEALRAEVGELAERVDFAERMLAQQRETARIDRPQE